MAAAFDATVERKRSRLTDDILARARRIVDQLYWLSPLEGWLLIREIDSLREENTALRERVSR